VRDVPVKELPQSDRALGLLPKEEAEKLGAKATGSEIVGLVPKESLVIAGKFYSKKLKRT
jgi:glutamate formiminotransferase